MAIAHFDSPGELGRIGRKLGAHAMRALDHSGWYGGENFARACDFAEHGNDAYVKGAEAMLEKINADLIEIPTPEWRPEIAGAFPVVPDFLAGHPENMRRRVNDISDRAPVRLYVCTTSSAGIDAEILKRRGTAILALIMALTPVRAVELYAFSTLDGDGGEGITCTRVPVETMHLGIAANALCGQGWARGLSYGYSFAKHGSHGGWPRGYRYGDDVSPYLQGLVRRMGGADHNVIIKPTELRDEIVKNPIKWVNDRIREYTTMEGAA